VRDPQSPRPRPSLKRSRKSWRRRKPRSFKSPSYPTGEARIGSGHTYAWCGRELEQSPPQVLVARGGRERTAEEFRNLLKGAGLGLTRVIQTIQVPADRR
jgi:hypothetical protein